MLRLVAVLFLSLLPGVPAGAVEGITAAKGLDGATAEARKWKPDAALTGVASTAASPDGTSMHWTYSFQSKSTRTCLRVVVLAAGKTLPTDLGECTLGTAIADKFVDSSEAVKAATAAGFKAGEEVILVLAHKHDQNLTPSRECWSVSSREHDFDPQKAVMRDWCVDPKSGKFVTRTAGQGGHGK